ncbi:MAG TPA: malto-oligosyltrehalose trehalohydrolase [Pirellulales bacterium]|jgi:maltooligosyltrehalose trehalohydrolase
MIGVVDELIVPPQGAVRQPDGSTRWCIWAPKHDAVSLILWEKGERREHRMRSGDDGHFRWIGRDIAHGERYAYRLAGDGREYPDPFSRWQPEGVHQPSAVFDPHRFIWSDSGWKGVAAEALSIYELHVGTFTREGTFAAVAERLRDLRDLGITGIEIMPISQFSGARNWGYDGVHPFAAQNSYGGPEELQRLVDTAHGLGMAVLLDVVYNHLGPEGNYFGAFAPYFTDRYHTPWGSALNYDGRDCDPVRRLVLDSATMWIRDFHLDGLRLDAVQTIYDTSALHILAELQESVQRIAREQNRHVIVIGETNQNDVRLVAPREHGGYALDGIWADDFHHSVHALLTDERDGYYAEFGPPEYVAKALRDVFVYDGRYSPFHRRRHGNRAGDTPREKFVFCVQNHDQIGNRALGDRLAANVSPAELRLAAALLLLSPAMPLLFMGEEYGERQPFPFFCSFSDPGLVAAVRRGRRAELASVKFQWKHEPPDPQGEAAFLDAKLSWDWQSDSQRAGLRALYQDLLAARQAWFTDPPREVTCAEILGGDGKSACLWCERGGPTAVQICANLSGQTAPVPRSPSAGSHLMLSTAAGVYGGTRANDDDAITQLGPYECLVWGPAELSRPANFRAATMPSI